eukprot:symbB.v1.2.000211.t3/scaffold21.1/size436794/30
MPIPISEPEPATQKVLFAPKEASPQQKLQNARTEHVKGLVANLWRSREDGDFVFHVCGGTLRAHGCILSAASPVFKAMLASGMAEGLSSSMTVDADPSELLAMLRFIYLGELDATGQQLPGVLELAHKYEVLDLIPPVCEAMVEQLTIDTAVPFVHVLRLLEGSVGPEEVQLQEGIEVQEAEVVEEVPSCGSLNDPGAQWMAFLPESLPSGPPATRTTCTGLSQPVQPVEVAYKERPIEVRTGEARVPEVSPIAKAFQAVAKKILGSTGWWYSGSVATDVYQASASVERFVDRLLRNVRSTTGDVVPKVSTDTKAARGRGVDGLISRVLTHAAKSSSTPVEVGESGQSASLLSSPWPSSLDISGDF